MKLALVYYANLAAGMPEFWRLHLFALVHVGIAEIAVFKVQRLYQAVRPYDQIDSLPAFSEHTHTQKHCHTQEQRNYGKSHLLRSAINRACIR